MPGFSILKKLLLMNKFVHEVELSVLDYLIHYLIKYFS